MERVARRNRDCRVPTYPKIDYTAVEKNLAGHRCIPFGCRPAGAKEGFAHETSVSCHRETGIGSCRLRLITTFV